MTPADSRLLDALEAYVAFREEDDLFAAEWKVRRESMLAQVAGNIEHIQQRLQAKKGRQEILESLLAASLGRLACAEQKADEFQDRQNQLHVQKSEALERILKRVAG